MQPIPWTMTMSGRGDENERIEDFHGAPIGRVEGPSPDFRKNAIHERVILERRSPGLGPHYPPGRVDAKPDQQLAPDRGVPAECGGIERLQFGKVLAHSLPYHVPDPGRDRVSPAGPCPPEHCRNLHFPPHPHTGNPAGPDFPLQRGDLPPAPPGLVWLRQGVTGRAAVRGMRRFPGLPGTGEEALPREASTSGRPKSPRSPPEEPPTAERGPKRTSA